MYLTSAIAWISFPIFLSSPDLPGSPPFGSPIQVQAMDIDGNFHHPTQLLDSFQRTGVLPGCNISFIHLFIYSKMIRIYLIDKQEKSTRGAVMSRTYWLDLCGNSPGGFSGDGREN
jgi:hypothetical protein